MKKKQHHIPKVLLSKGLFFILIGLLLFFSVSMLREVKRKQDIQKDIIALEQELLEAEANNSQLSNLIDYLKTDDYAELEAKKRLGLKKQGEKVLLVTKTESIDTVDSDAKIEDLPNWKNWWNYFFN